MTPDGVELWWAAEGAGPAVLLVPGRGDPTDLFPQEFSAALAAGGLSVLRWDPRDTGLSADGGGTYTMSTLADDAVAVLDAAGCSAAHVVGISMAGLIMADLVSRHAERVSSLTFVAAMSPDPDAGMGDDFFGPEGIDPADRLGGLVHAMGETSPADRNWAAETLAVGARRAPHRPEAVARHQKAAFRLGWTTMDSLSSVSVPTLVVHGAKDRVLPVAHAEAFGSAVTGASVTVIDDMGHIPRLGDWLWIAEQIVQMTDPDRA